MKILAIETSCDDTCVAIIETENQEKLRFRILSNIVSSQVEVHKKWGGIYPSLAKREHQKNLPIVFKEAVKKAKSAGRRTKIDLISVTTGPGLEPCLWVGVNFAKDLSQKLELPILPVNHIEAHIFANFLDREIKINNLFPAICLVVSGGHTQLILMNPVRGQGNLVESQRKQTSNGVKDFGNYRILGETRDDAAGECLDKTARILGLGYPGGPAIAKLASQYKPDKKQPSVILPRPMIYQKNYDFSFSGLKTAVLYNFKNQKPEIRKSKQYIKAMSFEIQQAIIDVLIHKTIKAAKNYNPPAALQARPTRPKKVKTIILGGGVAANNELRKQFKKACLKNKFKCLIPDVKYCTDNAVMVAITAYYHWLKREKKVYPEIKADANSRIN